MFVPLLQQKCTSDWSTEESYSLDEMYLLSTSSPPQIQPRLSKVKKR